MDAGGDNPIVTTNVVPKSRQENRHFFAALSLTSQNPSVVGTPAVLDSKWPSGGHMKPMHHEGLLVTDDDDSKQMEIKSKY